MKASTIIVDSVPNDLPDRPLRTNMLLMATIYAGGGSAPVKVRNLSAGGALIEGVRIPDLASEITLRRGELAVDGTVVWSKSGRAGLKFKTAISVAYWLPGGETLRKQEMTDSVFHGPAGTSPLLQTEEPPQRLVTLSEITEVHDMLSTLANVLAEDDNVLISYAVQLQSLDFTLQLLKKLTSERR